jgi:hypothetical protein
MHKADELANNTFILWAIRHKIHNWFCWHAFRELKYLSRSQKLYPNHNELPRWLISIFITWVILTELVKSGFQITQKAHKKRQYKAKTCHFERAGLRICKQQVWACTDLIIQSETKISCMNLLWNILASPAIWKWQDRNTSVCKSIYCPEMSFWRVAVAK